MGFMQATLYGRERGGPNVRLEGPHVQLESFITVGFGTKLIIYSDSDPGNVFSDATQRMRCRRGVLEF
jgi:hypothetical protein